MSYELQQAQPRKEGCFGKFLKGVGAIVVLFIIVIFIAAIGNNSGSRSTTRASLPTMTPSANNTPAPPPTPTLTAQELESSAISMTFKELARNTEEHVGKLIILDGKVIQVVEDSGSYQMRISITKDDYGWSDPIFVICNDCAVRPLEEDIAHFVGTVDGRISYKSVLGGEITLPQVTTLTFEVEE